MAGEVGDAEGTTTVPLTKGADPGAKKPLCLSFVYA
jgi:hypothetical protein